MHDKLNWSYTLLLCYQTSAYKQAKKIQIWTMMRGEWEVKNIITNNTQQITWYKSFLEVYRPKDINKRCDLIIYI